MHQLGIEYIQQISYKEYLMMTSMQMSPGRLGDWSLVFAAEVFVFEVFDPVINNGF